MKESDPRQMDDYHDLEDQRDTLDAKLAELTTLDEMITLPTGEPDPNRQLLLLDTGGDRLKAAVSTGNVDIADHVAVFTPGLDNNVGNLEGKVVEMEQVRTDAEKVSSRKPGGAESVAMVTWLGYEPPALSSVREVLVDAAGQPMSPTTLELRLRQAGIPGLRGRTAALRQLVLQAPAPVVAKTLGFTTDHTARLLAEAGGTWARYAGGDHTPLQDRRTRDS